jgi:hypothetical protein
MLFVFLATIAVASEQQSRAVRYGPGVCGPIDPAYVKTATETGGQPFPLSIAEVAESARVMESSTLPEMMLWASGDRDNSYSIPVDSTVSRLMVSGTFDAAGGTLALFGPDGTAAALGERVGDTPLNCGRIVTVDKPLSGIWQLRIAPTGRFWLSVHAKSDLSLDSAEFVEQAGGSDRLVRIQGQPIVDRPVTLRATVSSEAKDPTFQLVSLDGRPLQSLDLHSVDQSEFTGTITIPAEPFRVLMTASAESGARAQRIWPGLFHGEVIEVVAPGGESVTAGTEVPVTFKIRSHGPALRLALVASDHRGRVIPVNPPALDVAAGEEGRATVTLRVPADAQPGSEVSVRVTATGDAKAAVGGFNSANKTFTVIRE